MTTKNNATWQKRFVETVDQRKRELPPASVSMLHVASARSERGYAVFESGRSREMANAVVSLLSQARERAVMSSFLLADKGVEDAILDAAKRGVSVYVLLASEARLGREEGEGEFDKRILDQHKAMLSGHEKFRTQRTQTRKVQSSVSRSSRIAGAEMLQPIESPCTPSSGFRELRQEPWFTL